MIFSSITFLYYFLPIVLIFYFAVPKKFRNAVLMVFSLLFYGWGEPKCLIFMMISIVMGYVIGLLLEKEERMNIRRLLMTASLLINLGMLGYFKYANFFVENFGKVTGISVPVLNVALPVGISFYTFQILSYVIDVYRRDVRAQRNIINLAAYITMFPQLIAGPIVRYSDLEKQLYDRSYTTERFMDGIRRFIIGLSKKVLIANQLGELCNVFQQSQEKSVAFFWINAIAFTLQIYFDFSGYSDMAIGLGKILGFDFMENFNYPYISKSITEFWRRWHMSLGTWFRDYVYIPLGGNRKGGKRQIFNIFVVWALTGFWHGAEWNFIAWGLYYAALLILEKLFLHKLLDKLPKFLRWIYAMVIVLVGWVMFNLTEPAKIIQALSQMFSFHYTGIETAVMANTDIVYALFYIPLGLICMLPWKNKINISKIPDWIINIACLTLFAISVVFIIGSTYNPFIYFRF